MDFDITSDTGNIIDTEMTDSEILNIIKENSHEK